MDYEDQLDREDLDDFRPLHDALVLEVVEGAMTCSRIQVRRQAPLQLPILATPPDA